jgi:PAS domain S-box-containing protein
VRKEIRKLGIDILSEASWGTHLCQFYQTKEDLIDILVPYFKAGLENNEFCMWVTSEPLRVEDAKKSLRKVVEKLDDYIKKGQIEILDASQWYTKSGKFEPDEVLEGWVEKEKGSLKRGFSGLRLTGNTFWLDKRDWRNFADYEAVINNVIGKYRMIAICSYSLDKCGASEVIDVVNNHQFALIRQKGKWVLIENTERKKREEALRESEERYRTLVQNVPIAVYRTIPGPKGKFLMANSTFFKIFGFDSEEELKEIAVADVYLNLEDRKVFSDNLLAKGSVDGMELPLRKKDGTVFWGSVTARVVYNENGKNPYFDCTIIDITERKKVKVELDRRIRELEIFQKVAVGRELKMVELKKRIKELETRLRENERILNR